MAMGWRDSTAQQCPKHCWVLSTLFWLQMAALEKANYIPENHSIIKCTNLQDINFLPFLFRNWSRYYVIPRSCIIKLILLYRINTGLNHIYLLSCDTGDSSEPLQNVCYILILHWWFPYRILCTVDSIIYEHCNGSLLLVSYSIHSSAPYKHQVLMAFYGAQLQICYIRMNRSVVLYTKNQKSGFKISGLWPYVTQSFLFIQVNCNRKGKQKLHWLNKSLLLMFSSLLLYFILFWITQFHLHCMLPIISLLVSVKKV